MKLYHFPSPNPQKVTFALLELGLDCEKIPVDLTKGDHREPAFLASRRASSGPRRRRRDADGIAGDPRLSRR
jgi:Glutathione S-transferase, N-terminal domain